MKTIEVVAAIIRKGDKIFATQRGYGPAFLPRALIILSASPGSAQAS